MHRAAASSRILAHARTARAAANPGIASTAGPRPTSHGAWSVLGFSLLEMMLVLVILVLAYGLASPLVANLSSGDLKASTRTIASALKRARNTAIASRQEVPLTFDLEARTLTLVGDPKPVQLPPKIDLQLYTVQQELASDKVASVRFYPDGSSTGGRVTVGRDDRKFEIDIDWLTGRVHINQPG